MSDQYTYGTKYQLQLVGLCLRDPQFLSHYQDILKREYFASASLGVLVDILTKYRTKYGVIPSLDNAMSVVREEGMKLGLEGNELVSLVSSLVDASKVDLSDEQWVKDKAIEFAQFQEAKNVVVRAAELLSDNPTEATYGEILADMQKVISVGASRDVGITFKETAPNLREILSRESAYNNKVRTGLPTLDDLMFGGLGKGELGVLMAPSGKGKSMGLVSLACAAIRAGHNPYYYTFELGDADVVLRMASNLTQVSMEDILSGDASYDKRVKPFAERDNTAVVKFFPARSVGVGSLRSHISFMASTTNIKPTIIFVDYADLISTGAKGYNSAETSAAMGRVYEELRALAHHWQVPVWTASQVRKSSWKDEIIDTEAVAESVQKINTSDAILTIAQSLEDRETGRCRLYVAKLRNGKDGKTIHCILDRSRATLVEDTEMQEKMNLLKSSSSGLSPDGETVTVSPDHSSAPAGIDVAAAVARLKK